MKNRIVKNLLQTFATGLSSKDAEDQAEQQLKKIQAVKVKIHEKYGLADIEPADDGMFQEDIILSSEEADELIQQLSAPDAGSQKSKRSASIYFEQYPGKKWIKMPIRYWISDEFTDEEKTIIDNALKNISIVAPCITFARDAAAATTPPQLQYVRDDSNCGGNTMLGRQGLHAVNMGYKTSAACTDIVYKGKVMHETIHALGGAHEMSRTDRDNYVEILWDNVDPQQASNFAIKNASTSYGVTYDYGSRMHYRSKAFNIDPTMDTIRPIVDTGVEMGGNYLTPNDILQLNRMYCRPATCVDKYQECGNWAAVEQRCNLDEQKAYMSANCARSCGLC